MSVHSMNNACERGWDSRVQRKVTNGTARWCREGEAVIRTVVVPPS